VANPFRHPLLDPLYGNIEFEPSIADLASQPLVQRLRHIRLSNVDSLGLPGIANVSRYEHALGTAALAARTTFAKRASDTLRICLTSAALVHDTAISPFGHLMEEALAYLGSAYQHESKWSLLQSPTSELGGVNLQLYLGYQSGLRDWADKFFHSDAHAIVARVIEAIRGGGKLGPAINGEVDLDNLDNVTRAAFHMGLEVDRALPIRVAEYLEEVSETGAVFSDDCVGSIQAWLELREQVYSRFMLTIPDFNGKLMLLSSIVEALKAGVIAEADWNMTDWHLIEVLLNSKIDEIISPLRRWLVGDVWDISELHWFEGPVPSFPALTPLTEELSLALSRPCFAYRIKDKRKRRIRLQLSSGKIVNLGEEPRHWLLGVGSPTKRPFTTKDNGVVIEATQRHFGVLLATSSERAKSLFA
jgi:HD superfamily phosphohydrolase